jgi:hypothetical protein
MDWTWSVSQGQSPNVHIINVSGPHIRKHGNEFRCLVSSDRHFDSIHSDRAMQRRHLEEAAAGGWPVIDLGDFFDAMQSRHDKRRAAAEISLRHASRDDYMNSLVEEAAEFMRPYSPQIAVIGRGNHETAVQMHNGVDLLSALAYRMRAENPACNVHLGGYGGWLFFRFTDLNSGPARSWSETVKVKYFHGSGGGGPVTKGTIQANRRAVFLPDADIVLTGHIHEDWRVSYPRERVSAQGRVQIDEQLHVCVPSYKEEYGTGAGGWHVERGAPPKPKGAAWLRFTAISEQVDKVSNQYRITVDADRAR